MGMVSPSDLDSFSAAQLAGLIEALPSDATLEYRELLERALEQSTRSEVERAKFREGQYTSSFVQGAVVYIAWTTTAVVAALLVPSMGYLPSALVVSAPSGLLCGLLFRRRFGRVGAISDRTNQWRVNYFYGHTTAIFLAIVLTNFSLVLALGDTVATDLGTWLSATEGWRIGRTIIELVLVPGVIFQVSAGIVTNLQLTQSSSRP
jgi:hypothetical protein